MLPPNGNHRPRGLWSLCSRGGPPFLRSPTEAPPEADRGRARLAPVPWRSGQVGIAIVLALSCLFPVSAVAFKLGRLGGSGELALATWVSSHLLGLVLIAVVWYVGLKPHRASLVSLGLSRPGLPWAWLLGLSVGVVAVSLGFNLLYGMVADRLGSSLLKPPDIPRNLIFPGVAAVFTFQALALWTPVAEEIFFRGFIFPGLAPRLGVGGAAVASASIFSLFHIFQGSPGVLIPVFVAGLLLAWLYHRTGSLWACVVAHAGQNIAALGEAIYGV